MKPKYKITVLFFIFAYQLASAQWTKQKNNGFYKLSIWSLTANEHFTNTGETDPNATRGVFNVNFYGEYGVTDPLDVILYVPFFARNYQNDQISGTTGEVTQEGEAINSIGDIDLGVRYKLFKNEKLALSATLKFGIPVGESSGGSDGSFQTGDGEFNQLIKTDLGTSFQLGNVPMYGKIYLGFNNRTEGFSDEIHLGGEYGLSFLNKKLWIIGKLNSVQSTHNGSLSAQNAQGSIFANNVEFTNLGVEMSYYITNKVGVSFNYTTPLSGKIIYADPSFSGGVFLDIK